ncbi:MAG: Holliday junction branch migration protein RuvA [Nitriliruptoraceae bacterium]
MIAHLTGVVAERVSHGVVVDVHGVGYLVHVPSNTQVAARGTSISLHVHLHVREDALTLYGFEHRASKALFELLLGSSGVGPKLALAAIGSLGAERVASAIASSDVATLTEIPGVGRKVAERLVLDLQDKVGALAGSSEIAPASMTAGPTAIDEVRDALAGLGYQVSEIEQVLAHDDVDTNGEAADVLREALRTLGRRG